MLIKGGIKISRNKKLTWKIVLNRQVVVSKPKLNVSRLNRDKQGKVFCIGYGKTGTTSLEGALIKFGYSLGNQAVGEMLVKDWSDGDYNRILGFCHTAEAFQDLPFGVRNLYKILDDNFANSKFILTVRESPEVWYDSMIRFHTKLFSSDIERLPDEVDLMNSKYRYKGWILDMMKFLFDYPNIGLYDQEQYIKSYLEHIHDVELYFKDRPNDLLVLNVSEEGSYQKLAAFLGFEVDENANFPWLNKT